jgi:hypothetical protein
VACEQNIELLLIKWRQRIVGQRGRGAHAVKADLALDAVHRQLPGRCGLDEDPGELAGERRELVTLAGGLAALLVDAPAGTAAYITLASTVLICAALALGSLIDPLASVALFLSALIGALIWAVSTTDPDRRRTLREAASAARRDEAPDPRDRKPHAACRRAAHRAAPPQQRGLRIVAPILTSRVSYIASDVDTSSSNPTP